MGVAYNTSVVTNGLVLCLDAGNAKSYVGFGVTADDISGRANTGSFLNGVTFDSASKAFVFDGVDDSVTINSSVPLTNPFTVCAFVKPASSVSSVIYGPNINGDDNWLGTTNRAYVFVTQSADVNNFTMTGSTILNTTGTVWYLISCVIDADTVRLYVNDKQDAISVRPYTIAGWSARASLGRRAFRNQYYFNGSISWVMAYNRALSATEIQQNFSALRGRFGI